MSLRFQRAAAVTVCVVALAVLAGWAVDVLMQTPDGSSDASMTANAAIGLLLLADALLLQGMPHRRLRVSCALGAAVIGALTLADHLLGTGPAFIDGSLGGFGSAVDPGRMSVGTAVTFVLVGLALVLLGHRSPAAQVIAQVFLVGAAGVGLVALVGYGSGLGALYWQTDYTSLPLHMAAASLLIMSAALFRAARVGLIGSMTRATPGGALLRRLVPAVALLPFLVIIPIGRVEQAGGFGFGVGVLIIASVTVAAFLPVLFLTARALDRLDALASRESQRFAAVAAEREHLLAESRAVLNATTEGILLTDTEGAVLLTNSTMRTFWEELGLPSEGTIWERVSGLVLLTEDPERYARDLAALVRDPEREYVSEFTLQESGRSFLGRTAVVTAVEGRTIGRIFTLRDTTAERSSERAKEEFLASVSHELRTPLAAISGYLELFVDEHADSLQGSGREFLDVAERNVQRLARLVDDLLLVQQVKIDGVAIDSVDVDVTQLVEQCLENARPAAARRDISLSLEGDLGILAEADPLRLGQVVDNLLSNAVKFTPPGGATNVRLDRSGNGEWYTIDVSDSGPGIPEHERERLFRRFYRSSEAIAQAVPGTGLGLVVSRHIAEAHGGSLELVDSPDPGATFRVTLPLRAHDASSRAA